MADDMGRRKTKAAKKEGCSDTEEQQKQQHGAMADAQTKEEKHEEVKMKPKNTYDATAATAVGKFSPLGHLSPAEETSLDPYWLYKRSLSDTPYFSIAVQVKDGRFPVERPVFLDTSEQKMLYNPEVGTDLPMGNLSTIWLIRSSRSIELVRDMQIEEPDGPKNGPYTISNFVTQFANLETLMDDPIIIRGAEAFGLEVKAGKKEIFTLIADDKFELYSISTDVGDEKTAYLLPVDRGDSARSNIISAVVIPTTPGQRGPPADAYVFRIRGEKLQYTVTGCPKLFMV